MCAVRQPVPSSTKRGCVSLLATCKWHAEPWSENTLTLRQVCPQHHASSAPREDYDKPRDSEDLENTGQRRRAQAPELWS